MDLYKYLGGTPTLVKIKYNSGEREVNMEVKTQTKAGKEYKVFTFDYFEECAEYWQDAFLFNDKYVTKVIGKTIIAWKKEKK